MLGDAVMPFLGNCRPVCVNGASRQKERFVTGFSGEPGAPAGEEQDTTLTAHDVGKVVRRVTGFSFGQTG